MTTKPNDGGPAFPVHETPDSTDSPGMTLRDYFAAKAMQGLLAYPAQQPSEVDTYAMVAYTVADALLKARNT